MAQSSENAGFLSAARGVLASEQCSQPAVSDFGPSITGDTPRLGCVPVELKYTGKTPTVLPITSGGDLVRAAGFAVSLTVAGTKTNGVVQYDQPRALDLGSRNARRLERVPTAITDEIMYEVLAKLTPIFE